MEIGALDQRVRIEEQATEEDLTYGTQLGDWSELATEWAEVVESMPSHGETGSAMRIASRTARVRMRYRDDVTTSHRIVLLDRNNRIFRVATLPAEIDGRKRFIEFMAEEFTSVGDAA
jgi:head-tail adaptor